MSSTTSSPPSTATAPTTFSRITPTSDTASAAALETAASAATTTSDASEENLLGWDETLSVFLYNSDLSPRSGAVTLLWFSTTTAGSEIRYTKGWVFANTAVTPATRTTLDERSTRDLFYTSSLLGNALVLSVSSTTTGEKSTATGTATGTLARAPAASTDLGIADPGRYECVRDAGALTCRAVAEPSAAAPIAAAGVLGALFLLALVALVVLFMRLRRGDSKDHKHSAQDRKHAPLPSTPRYGGVGSVEDEGKAGGADADAGRA
ncbi:hypothetical protein EDC01DRAFT_724959, partial [Geopyxis carbonaria]